MRIHHPKTAKGRKALLHPRFEWKIYKGDVVGVNRGRFQGMVGEVIRTHKRYHELRVKGVNVVRRKVWDFKTDPESPQRVWVDREEPIHYSRVQLVDQVTQELTKLDWRYLESGERVRIARTPAVQKTTGLARDGAPRKSGAVVPKPVYVKPDEPVPPASPFDTPADAAHEVTYTPRGVPDYVRDMPEGQLVLNAVDPA